MTIVFAILLFIAAALWAGVVAGSLTMHQSDPAGNALAYSFTALGAGALWVMLAIVLLVAGGAGEMPMWSGALALVLVPLSGVAVQVALKAIQSDRHLKWPAIVPVIVPGLIIIYAIVCFFTRVRGLVGAIPAGGINWGTIAVLVPLPWIARARQRGAAARVAREAPALPEDLAEVKE